MRYAAILPLLVLLGGCQSAQILTPPPALTPVGSGLNADPVLLAAAQRQPEARAPSSLYSQGDQGLFRDLRARTVGDIVTVSIAINDKAQFDNASGRSETASAKATLAADFGYGGFGSPDQKGSLSGGLNGTGSASAKGEGSINRSETLSLLVAAVVTGVLPNGSILISGSQEVRVNNEVRVLTIAGIVRPLDIAKDNTIAYDKIAEARVSYGGRGKLTAVQ